MRESTPSEIAIDAVKYWRDDPRGMRGPATISIFGITYPRNSLEDAKYDANVIRKSIRELVARVRSGELPVDSSGA